MQQKELHGYGRGNTSRDSANLFWVIQKRTKSWQKRAKLLSFTHEAFGEQVKDCGIFEESQWALVKGEQRFWKRICTQSKGRSVSSSVKHIG